MSALLSVLLNGKAKIYTYSSDGHKVLLGSCPIKNDPVGSGLDIPDSMSAYSCTGRFLIELPALYVSRSEGRLIRICWEGNSRVMSVAHIIEIQKTRDRV